MASSARVARAALGYAKGRYLYRRRLDRNSAVAHSKNGRTPAEVTIGTVRMKSDSSNAATSCEPAVTLLSLTMPTD